MKFYQSVIEALLENMLRVTMLLSFFGLPGILAGCPNPVLIIDTPGQIEALSGSCLLIPCSFSTTDTRYDKKRPIYGIWFKGTTKINANPNPAIFNSSGSVNTYSLKMIGNLSEENCTSLFPDLNTSYTDKYFFRIQNWPFRANAACHPLQITVRDSPWSPSINITVGDLKEHQSVTITCSALTPCPHSPPELTWNLQQHSHRQTEKNTNGTFTTKIQENITLSDTHDGYNISCSARYPVNERSKTAETEMTLSVSYAPKDTSASISPSGLVSAGSWVELSCSSRAKPPPSFNWFRNSKHGAINVSLGQVYSFNATEGGDYYCEANNELGNQRSSVIMFGLKAKASLPFVPITVGISVAVFLVVCLVLAVGCLMSKHSTAQEIQSQTCVEADVQSSNSHKTEEELYYGEINIIRKTAEASSFQAQNREQQEMVYAKVKVSMPENNSTQTVDSPEDLYAQVKKI